MLEFLINIFFITCKIITKNMANAGSPLFRIGYLLYTKTPIGKLYYGREIRKSRQLYQKNGHSVCEAVIHNGLKILPIAMSLDNYGYLVLDERAKMAILIDPADSEIVQQVLEEENVTPTAILTTHKHWDHSYGNTDLKRRYPDVRVYGSVLDKVPACTDTVVDLDVIAFGQLQFTVLSTPGHTVGHVAYLLEGSPFGCPQSLFSGDVLFLGGMGRMFEGNATTMQKSLEHLQEYLPDDGYIWPGHEYASDDLDFASHVDPENDALKKRIEWVKERRKERLCTPPSTMGEEKSYNPFLRVTEKAIVAACGLKTEDFPVNILKQNCLQELRAQKDKYKYRL